jgi:hypothetical protein
MLDTWESLDDFASECAVPEKADDAKALVEETKAAKDNDDFDAAYVDDVMPRYEEAIKPEHHHSIRDFFKKELDLLDNPDYHDPADII